jgi:tetratricopeptide (TPR) repeat protein
MNVLFSSYLLSNNMAEAMLISEKVSKHIKNYKPLQQAQWEYYKNLILFKKEDFEEAMKYFVKSTVLNQDSTGWHLGLKIMEIYCLFELKDGFSLDLRIGAFGKFLSRRKQSKNLFRYRAIYKVLYSLHNSNYSYNKTFNKHRKLLEDLAEARGMMYRDPLAFELICPRDWLKSKCTKEKNPK